jgi:hypothetical protein
MLEGFPSSADNHQVLVGKSAFWFLPLSEGGHSCLYVL